VKSTYTKMHGATIKIVVEKI